MNTFEEIELLLQQKEAPLSAVIREAECIGCTKCIQACPVDAIMGAAKQMHTVLLQECIGCELCVEPCPVDCIDMVVLPKMEAAVEINKINLARQRFQLRRERLAKIKNIPKVVSMLETRKAAIREAVERVKARKKISS